MRTHGIRREVWTAFVAVLLLAAPAAAQDEAPPQVHKGDVVYMTGGYGLGEREAMEAVKKDYNLYITNANRAGQFTAGITVEIAPKAGGETVVAGDVGPLFYVKLPRGVYTIKAKNGGKEQVRTVNTSGSRKTTIHFTWGNGIAKDPAMHMNESMSMEQNAMPGEGTMERDGAAVVEPAGK